MVGTCQPHDYGTHSLRQTKASICYKAKDNLRAVQILLGHAKMGSTVRYLGVAWRTPRIGGTNQSLS